MKPPSVIMPGIFRTIPNALLLLVLLVNLTVLALADDGKKILEAQAQQLTSEGRAFEDKQQFKEAEEKYTAAEAITSTKDGKNGLERIQKAEAKKFHDLLAEAHGLFDAGKPADAARRLEEAKSLAPQDPALHYNLAVCYQKSGDRLKAVSEMDQTLSLLPENDKNRAQLEQVRSAMRSLDASHCGMTTLFPCAEFQHLRREYETALRVWGQYEFPLPNAALGLPEQPFLKQNALDARNAAKERLIDHREKCRICKIEQRLNEWPRRHRPKAG